MGFIAETWRSDEFTPAQQSSRLNWWQRSLVKRRPDEKELKEFQGKDGC